MEIYSLNVCIVTSPRFNCKPTHKALAPLGLAYLAAVARDAGHNVTVVEGVFLGNPTDIAKKVAMENPDVVGTNTVTIDRLAGIASIREIRQATPNAFIVVGGSHFSHSAEDALRCVREIDAVVVGEGEQTFWNFSIIYLIVMLSEKFPASFFVMIKTR